MKHFYSGLLLLVLTGCTSVDDPFLNATAPNAGGPALSTSASREVALASLPVAGGASAVRQTVQDGKAEQLIVYPNATTIPGENLLTVSAGTSGKARRAPSRELVVAEMRKAVPGVRMSINPSIGENSYGVFGYATGALPGNANGSCLYAWQVTPQQAKPSLSGNARAASIRLRYCSTASSEEEIVGLMRGLRLKQINANTIDGLQMASGAGIGDIEMFAAETPVTPRVARREVARAVVVEEQAAVPVTSVVREPKPVETKAETVEQPAEKPVAVANPVKVPMPGDAAVLAETKDEGNEPSAEVAESAQVPLPGKLLIATTK